jgi:hypothetical protein
MSNWMKIVELLLKGTVADVAKFAEKSEKEVSDIILSLRMQLMAAVIVPLVLLVIGVTFGASASTIFWENVGHGFIVVAGFIAVSMMGILLIRSGFYATVIFAASNGVSDLFHLSILPDTTKAKLLVQKCAGVMAWITGVCLYAQVVPVWRSVGISLIVATGMMGVAFLMVSGKFNSKLGWYALMALTLLAIVFSTARLASPSFAATLAEYECRNLGCDGKTDAEKLLKAKFEKEKDDIQMRVAEKCGGHYCNEADRAQFAELDKRLRELRTGHYWENAGVVESAVSTSSQPAIEPKSATVTETVTPTPTPETATDTDTETVTPAPAASASAESSDTVGPPPVIRRHQSRRAAKGRAPASASEPVPLPVTPKCRYRGTDGQCYNL